MDLVRQRQKQLQGISAFLAEIITGSVLLIKRAPVHPYLVKLQTVPPEFYPLPSLPFAAKFSL